MAKEKTELVPASEQARPEQARPEQAPVLAPADYQVVGLDEGVAEVYIPVLSRTYTLDELKRLDLLELLHRLGWPHVEKKVNG